MIQKHKLRVLSFFTLGTGVIFIALSLIFTYTYIGGYKGSVEVRQRESAVTILAQNPDTVIWPLLLRDILRRPPSTKL